MQWKWALSLIICLIGKTDSQSAKSGKWFHFFLDRRIVERSSVCKFDLPIFHRNQGFSLRPIKATDRCCSCVKITFARFAGRGEKQTRNINYNLRKLMLEKTVLNIWEMFMKSYAKILRSTINFFGSWMMWRLDSLHYVSYGVVYTFFELHLTPRLILVDPIVLGASKSSKKLWCSLMFVPVIFFIPVWIWRIFRKRLRLRLFIRFYRLVVFSRR